MQLLDASSIIHAWDNYPMTQFPGLWEWMAEQIGADLLMIPRVALEEVEGKIPECAKWLKDEEITSLEPTGAIISEALRIKKLLGIVGDKYHPKGVGENDLFIIATARVHEAELVSDEGRQAVAPKDPSKHKIPAVCAMPEVAVTCISFIEFLKRSNAIFR